MPGDWGWTGKGEREGEMTNGHKESLGEDDGCVLDCADVFYGCIHMSHLPSCKL